MRPCIHPAFRSDCGEPFAKVVYRTALAELSTSAPAAALRAANDVASNDAEKQIVDGADFRADAIDREPTGGRDAQQHAAAIERIGALEQKPAPGELARLRSR